MRRRLVLATLAFPVVLIGLSASWLAGNFMDPQQIRERLWAGHSPAREWTWTPLWAISPRLQAAVVAWEDPTFYHHGGIAYEEVARALWSDIQAGAYVRGGSTITQQVAKNLFLSPEKTLRRKLRETILAWRLERALSKDEILEVYLNIAEWGEGIAGAEVASQFYFGKSAANLDWPEAALLAGMLPNPRRINPLSSPQVARKYQILVLEKLYESKALTDEEFGLALLEAEGGPSEAPAT